MVPVLSKLGVFAQFINGLTEFGIIHALVLAHISAFFGAYAGLWAIACAAFGVFILEMGQRTFLPFAARAVLHRRFAGLDLWMSLFIFAVTVCLFGASLYLSFAGSRDLVAATAPPPALLNETEADRTLQTANQTAEINYQAEVNEITNRYKGLATSTKNAQNAHIEREKRTRQRYESVRDAKIAALNAECAAKLADLDAAMSTELQAAKSRQLAALDAATATRQTVTNHNNTAQMESRVKVAQYGGGLGWLTVVFHLVLVLSLVITEMHRKGSGIELVAAPNQYHFSESIWAKFWNTASDKWNYTARTFIQRWADTTPAPPKPADLHPLYELGDWRPHRLNLATTPPPPLTFSPDPDAPPGAPATSIRYRGASVANLTTAGPRYAYAPSADKPTAAPATESDGFEWTQTQQADTDGKKNIWAGTTADGYTCQITEVTPGCFHTAVKNPDGKTPFDSVSKLNGSTLELARRECGKALARRRSETQGSVTNATVKQSGFAKICVQCGQDFTAKVGWQKFCSEGCKMAFHEAKHGSRFDPNSYHRRGSARRGNPVIIP